MEDQALTDVLHGMLECYHLDPKLVYLEVIRFIMNMAKALNMQVISEEIETKEQAELIYDMGCDFAQGYYYSKPRPFV
ncbi:EAL domain-containing protein [Clostridium sp. OF09-36]|uniref:EAL domain-containing protein n=1 Tax=Clostridium sp. OF09-36 TaxID=2292310 RepID=UPI0011C21B8D|nr:EAL domain-containing protein [Clostridium sp. OF09-36]